MGGRRCWLLAQHIRYNIHYRWCCQRFGQPRFW